MEIWFFIAHLSNSRFDGHIDFILYSVLIASFEFLIKFAFTRESILKHNETNFRSGHAVHSSDALCSRYNKKRIKILICFCCHFNCMRPTRTLCAANIEATVISRARRVKMHCSSSFFFIYPPSKGLAASHKEHAHRIFPFYTPEVGASNQRIRKIIFSFSNFNITLFCPSRVLAV